MKEQFDKNNLRTYLMKLASIPEEEWTAFSNQLAHGEIQKGNFFLRAGEVPQQIGFVVNGLFKKFYQSEDGREYIKDFSSEGKLVTAYSALLQGQPSIMNIQAVEDSQLFLIPYKFWTSLYDRHSCWQEVGRKIAERVFIDSEQRERDLLTHSASKRYELFVVNNPHLKVRLPQYDVASYLGISPVSLSRIVSKIKNF